MKDGKLDGSLLGRKLVIGMIRKYLIQTSGRTGGYVRLGYAGTITLEGRLFADQDFHRASEVFAELGRKESFVRLASCLCYML